jgi:Na+/H+-dicarboxylate symporter/ABC-type amino acid transport substrate-binding protein
MSENQKRGPSLSSQIAIALATGIFFGIFLGEPAGFLSVVADGYINLLQMTVLPYVIVSLISGLGTLQFQQAKTIFFRVGGLMVLLWGFTLILVFLIPLTFPSWASASFFSTALVQPRQKFDFIGLYIPANPFHSLANNVVPAVVLFSAVIGVALIGIEKKERLIEVLDILNHALSAARQFVIRLTPIGVFAIAANAAGTMSIEEFSQLQIFFFSYISISLLLSFWFLPGFASALTSIPHREILSATKDALMTAFATGNLFIVLPMLSQASKELLRRHKLIDDDDTTTDIIVPASFNFPSTGKVLSLSFILFAGWFAGTPIATSQYPAFAATGIMSFFGSVNLAVPFLLDLFRIPADMFQLFVATGVINSRFGTLVAAMHVVVLAVAGTCAATGTIVWSPRRLIHFTVVSLALIVLTFGTARYLFTNFLEQPYRHDQIIAGMHLLRERVPAVVLREEPATSPPVDFTRPRLEQIRERGVLRVGYFAADSLPYAYFNEAGDLVGLDVEMAYILAEELDVTLEFVPADRRRLATQLQNGYCDVVMSGLVITTARAATMTFSAPYMHATVAFVVADHRRGDFATRESILAQKELRIGIPGSAVFQSVAESFLPDTAQIVPMEDISAQFEEQMAKVDALLLSAERGSFWTLLHPAYSVVVPQPNVIEAPLAYPVARGDLELARFMTTWIELKKGDGTLDALYDYWIMGTNAEPRQPRWSILRDVLHWVD